MRAQRYFSAGACALAAVAILGINNALAQSATAPAASTVTAPAAASAPQNAGKPYFIEFRARSALSYGHTFAVLGRVGQKLTKKNVVGLHPATDSSVPWVIGHVVAVPSETGWSDGDIEDQYIIARYRIPLSVAEYKNVSEFAEKLKANSPHWHAVFYNCNAFVGRIADYMGLRVPSSSLLLPKEYITELKQLNAGPKQHAATAGSRSVQ
jgi:hypothetical protein